MYNAFWPYVRRYIHRLLDENPCELVVSVHPLINTPVRRALAGRGIPFATVVTDMVSTHAAWYDAYARPIIVATDEAKHRALKLGMRADQVYVIGQPVAESFCHPPEDRAALRRKLGWPEDRPVILLVGGGEGMGPLHDTAKAIDHARLPAALVVICGRNRKLKERLEAHNWQIPVLIYGFVREMPDFMAAADILVTKAGPGTISEAFIAGLPLVLYARLPGQEDGNVTYVIDHGAGAWAPDSDLVVEVLQKWLNHPEERMRVREVCLKLARPQASRQIARLLAAQVGLINP
jgi:1,2-diacylglycerol 3-beta-galactosyltransferase